ncbi:MAG: Penicillin-binding protein, 1A family [Microgenomates group bacterium GW2011_GWA2_46_7]|nr:MAG: Penicillin-binding protein, 1A family [Microgenomates group bacterium GW2011_GWA2_46_7]
MQDWAQMWKQRKYGRRGRVRWDKQTILKYLGLTALFGTLLGIFVMFVMFAWFARSLPDPNKIVRREGFSTKILDRDGGTLYELYQDYNRIPIKLAEVPKQLQQATIAIEDKEFYTHQGFSTWGMIRGLLRGITRGRAQGGSTLTQQLVKNVLLTSERSLPRKFKELVLSLQIERKFSKDEILQMYLNEAPYGGTAVGIAAASERYFGIEPKELTLTQSAILAGMPQAPSRYSPYGSDKSAYVARAMAVLRRMREDGYIDKETENTSVKELEGIQFREQTGALKAAHFVFYVKDQLVELLGEALVEEGGYTVTTTLDSELQDFAQTAVKEEIDKLEKVHVTNGAAMVLSPQNGEILSMVGSKDYFAPDYDGKVNVVMSSRQPGSAIKPVTYATAFAKGYSPSSVILDVATKFPGAKEGEFYEPKNYDGKFHGPVQLRYALSSSLNIPAVKLLALVGIKDMLQQAYDMGFPSLEPIPANMTRFGLSVTLGGGEVRLFDLVHAYAAFANGGERVEPVAILKVVKEGRTLYESKQAQKKRVLTPEVAFLINHILYDNNARLLTFGANSYLNMSGRSIAVKTGTTNDKRDNWTIGWSTKAVVGVWVGNNDNSQMKEVASGVTGASPIWRKIMLKTWEKYKGDDFVAPPGVESRLVDIVSGYPEHDGYPTRADYFVKGTAPTEPDPIHTKVKVCRSDENKLASEVDIARGEFNEKEYYVLKNESSLWQDDIWAWIDSQGEAKYKVPREYCNANTETVIGFEKPSGNSRVETNTFEVRLGITTSREIEWIKLYKNGTEIESFGASKQVTTNITLPDGTYELMGKVKTKDGAETSTTIKIGVRMDYDFVPSPTASASATP